MGRAELLARPISLVVYEFWGGFNSRISATQQFTVATYFEIQA
jgi:hypothetical protein